MALAGVQASRRVWNLSRPFGREDADEADDTRVPNREPEHKRTTRERTARATGCGGKTLDKAEKCLASWRRKFPAS